MLPTPDLKLTRDAALLCTFAWMLCVWVMFRSAPGLRRVERRLVGLARRRSLSIGLVFALALLTRLAMQLIAPTNPPAVHDEFSYLLAADTFASGRLTNPAHPLWQHFETFHVLSQPTYMSMYAPGQGLALALGKVAGGSFAFGVWLSVAAMCAAICWMLQGWLPPRWALFGGILVVIRFAAASYWATSYWGGAVAAMGGALLLGALPRIKRRARARDAVIGGIGLLVLANTRMYEGLVLGLGVAAALLIWFVHLPREQRRNAIMHSFAPMAMVLVLGAAAMGYYCWRVTGNPLTLPYMVNLRFYAYPPLFVWGELPAPISYHHEVMREFYQGWAVQNYSAATENSLSRWLVIWALTWIVRFWPFYVGFGLLLPFGYIGYVMRDRRTRFLVIATGLGVAALTPEVKPMLHYAAPFTAAIVGVLMQGLRHLRMGNRRSPLRLAMTWSIPIACLLGLVFTVLPAWEVDVGPQGVVFWVPGTFGARRAELVRQLESLPGQHLVVVRYSRRHNLHDEWVQNRADIDHARIVFAREMGGEPDRALVQYFRTRHIWLLEPDVDPPRLRPVVVQSVPAEHP